MIKHPRVLGVAYGGGHANIVIPVLKTLAQRGIDTQFMALTSAMKQAESQNIPYKSYRDYRHLVDWKKAEALGFELAREMHSPDIGIPEEESVAYLGINLLENLETLGDRLTMSSLELVGRHSFLAVEFLKQVIAEERCTHILTTNAPRSEKASLIAAQQLGLKSFRIDDLYGVPVLFDSLTRKMGLQLYRQTTGRYTITPTQCCFLCDYAREHFISQQDKWDMAGIDYSNASVTGQPVFDVIDEVIHQNPSLSLFEHRQQFPTVIWAHENGHVDEAEMVSVLAQCFQNRGQAYNFVIKIRPSIDPAQLESILSLFNNELGNLRIVHTEIDPNVLIWNSDIVVGQVSTMLSQAAYMGKPVVIVDPRKLRRDEPLVMSQLARVVEDDRQLLAAIKGLSKRDSPLFEKFEQGRRAMNFKRQGTVNVSDLIERHI